MNNNDSNNICIRSWGRRRNGGIRWRWDLRKYKIKLTTHLTHKWSTYTHTREFNSGKQYIYMGTRANFYMYNALVDGWVFGAFADFFSSLQKLSFQHRRIDIVRATLFFFCVVYIHFTSSPPHSLVYSRYWKSV